MIILTKQKIKVESFMELTKKRWIILIASCFINLCVGSIYAWSVFAAPMAKHLSSTTGLALTAASLAIAFVITNSIAPITMISGGRINDMFGPKKVIFVGGLLFGGGMILAGFAQGVGSLVFAYGIVTGLGTGLVYGCTINNSIKFFPDKRGLIGGITTAAYGLSSVIVPPIANVLIDKAGVTSAFKIIGIDIGLICLYFSGQGDVVTFYIGISIVGLCFGSFMGVFPGFTADQFGSKNNSVNYGIMFIGFALGGYYGPTVMSNVFNTDNSYQRAFILAAVIGMVGFLLTFVYRYVNKKDMNTKESVSA
ncbi:MAG: MFS family permease [Clostridium sp.]